MSTNELTPEQIMAEFDRQNVGPSLPQVVVNTVRALAAEPQPALSDETLWAMGAAYSNAVASGEGGEGASKAMREILANPYDPSSPTPAYENFDTWMQNPYTKVLMKSMDEDYVPRDRHSPIPLDKYRQFADVPTPMPASGTWTLTAPDGNSWHEASPIKCLQAEQKDRVPAHIALGRIARGLEEETDANSRPNPG